MLRPDFVQFNNVSFGYDCAEPLIKDFSESFAPGWTGVVGENGSGKTTILRLAAGELQVQSGSIQSVAPALYCPQRTDEVPENLEELLCAPDKFACKRRGKLELEWDWAQRWNTLSHGERKRSQIAAALWQEPAFLNETAYPAREIIYRRINQCDDKDFLSSFDFSFCNQI